jgi:hypothetical protein
VSGESLQIRGGSCAARRIESRDGEENRRSAVAIVPVGHLSFFFPILLLCIKLLRSSLLLTRLDFHSCLDSFLRRDGLPRSQKSLARSENCRLRPTPLEVFSPAASEHAGNCECTRRFFPAQGQISKKVVK